MVRVSRLTAVASTATFLLLALRIAAARVVQAEPVAHEIAACLQVSSGPSEQSSPAKKCTRQSPSLSPTERADIKRRQHETWQMGLDLDMPSLIPQAVQYAIFDKDPVPAFVAKVKGMQGHSRQEVEKADSEGGEEQLHAIQMKVAWDLGFREVTGDNLYLLTKFPGKFAKTSMMSNAPGGKKWVVTKTVAIEGKPVCWCIPVEVKFAGPRIDVIFSKSNTFALEAVYNKAMQKSVGDTAGSASESAASRDKKEGRLRESATAMPELTREYLLANGFKQSATAPDSFIAEKVRLGDVASILGFTINSLRPTVSQPDHSDVRTGSVQERRFVVRSEVRDAKGQIVRASLNKPDAICTVQISLKKYVPPKPPLRSDSNPRLRVKSVAMPKGRTGTLQVTFELAADGKTPLGLLECQFNVCVTKENSPVSAGGAQLPDGSIPAEFSDKSFGPAGNILVKPGSPITLTAKVPDETTISLGEWSGLDPGKYVVRIFIEGRGTMKGMGYDYLWHDGNLDGRKVESDKFEFTVKGN